MRWTTKLVGPNRVRHSYYVSWILRRANKLQAKADKIVDNAFGR